MKNLIAFCPILLSCVRSFQMQQRKPIPHHLYAHRVSIIGGGFGGLYTALELDKKTDPSLEITLFDSNEKFVFLPLLYELAVGRAAVAEVAPTFNNLLKGTRIKFVNERVESVDFNTRKVLCNDATVEFDQCVIAVGNQPRLAMIPGAAEHAVPFYRVEDAYKLQARLRSLVSAGKDFIRVVVIGGGYSGVEVLTSVAEYLRDEKCVFSIVDRNELIMAASSQHNRDVAMRSLQCYGVSIHTSTTVSEVTSSAAHVTNLKTNETFSLDADLVILTSGLEQTPLIRSLDLPKDSFGRVATSRTLQVRGRPNIFALGDCSSVDRAKLSSTAQVAMQQAKVAAANVWRRAQLYDNKLSDEMHSLTAQADSTPSTGIAPTTTTATSVAPDADNTIIDPSPTTATPTPSDSLSHASTSTKLPIHHQVSKPGELDSFVYVPLGEMLTLGSVDAALSGLGGVVRLQGPLAALARRAVYALRMPTASQRVEAAVSAGVSSLAFAVTSLGSALRSRSSATTSTSNSK